MIIPPSREKADQQTDDPMETTSSHKQPTDITSNSVDEDLNAGGITSNKPDDITPSQSSNAIVHGRCGVQSEDTIVHVNAGVQAEDTTANAGVLLFDKMYEFHVVKEEMDN